MRCISFFKSILLLLIIFNYHKVYSNEKNCGDYLSAKSSDSKLMSNSVRDRIFIAAEEVLSQTPDNQDADLNWKKGVVLKSKYVLDTIIKINKSLKSAIESPIEPAKSDIAVSAKVLIDFTQQIAEGFAEQGIRYDWFLKISYLYAIHIEVLRYSSIYSNYGDDGFKVFMRSASDLNLNLELDDYIFRKEHYMPSGRSFNEMLSNKQPFVLIPSFANLGFETLLWLQSRGVGVLGLSAEIQNVDGRAHLPRDFFEHDIVHASFFSTNMKNNKFSSSFSDFVDSAAFYDEMATVVRQTSKTERERSIKMAIAFLLFHERRAPISQSCEGIHFAFLINEGFSSRLRNVKSDLGQAFSVKKLKPKEIADALESMKQILFSICK